MNLNKLASKASASTRRFLLPRTLFRVPAVGWLHWYLTEDDSTNQAAASSRDHFVDRIILSGEPTAAAASGGTQHSWELKLKAFVAFTVVCGIMGASQRKLVPDRTLEAECRQRYLPAKYVAIDCYAWRGALCWEEKESSGYDFYSRRETSTTAGTQCPSYASSTKKKVRFLA
ncbi:hypothetical protein SELMODRAFT_408281 [Selaginella moellendorffii]|uniref:Uncharacterized protein n=1 Tax=Selaginella moellendorffii TaxID=88036 RepID=D8R7T1_SELML|nr:hypothetical protein SELMODRAFT_408281 [Selaginella moellendorffii]